ncbi:MAG: hypothetical protein E7384_07245 [Ruminococcaceae bacterium]|nr:hypothetical protein [Oscillospiraceae bacterium]
MAKKSYYFVKKNSKKNLILMLVILVVSCVILAVVSLIPSRLKDTWLNTDNGTARSVMYPFVYTADNSLYVLDENQNSTVVDDTVTSCIHDVKFNHIYYLRDGKLYEYDIDTNRRIALSDGVAKFKLFRERTSILCTNNANDLYLYSYKNKGSLKLNKTSLQNLGTDTFYKLGNEYFLFLDNYNFEKNTATLVCSDLKGNLKKIADSIDASKAFHISDNDEFISYYKENKMYVTEVNGKVVKIFDNAKVVVQNILPVITEPCTKTEFYSDSVSFMYLMTDISSDGSSGTLTYFTKKETKVVDKNVRSIIHFSDNEKFILYTKDEPNGFVSLYKCQKSGKPSKIITCMGNSTFFFNESSTFLYIQSAEGFLRRVNVFDKGYKVTDVSEGSGVLFDYAGKSFVGYHNLDGDFQYLILDTNSIEKFSVNEIRYYGKLTNRYLLTRENGQGKFSLDYSVDGRLTRIADGIDKNIYFDKEFNNIIYSKEGKMFVWSDGNVSEVAQNTNINAVTVISAR